jgi:hypothetical protein
MPAMAHEIDPQRSSIGLANNRSRGDLSVSGFRKGQVANFTPWSGLRQIVFTTEDA